MKGQVVTLGFGFMLYIPVLASGKQPEMTRKEVEIKRLMFSLCVGMCTCEHRGHLGPEECI